MDLPRYGTIFRTYRIIDRYAREQGGEKQGCQIGSIVLCRCLAGTGATEAVPPALHLDYSHWFWPFHVSSPPNTSTDIGTEV